MTTFGQITPWELPTLTPDCSYMNLETIEIVPKSMDLTPESFISVYKSIKADHYE